MAPQKLLSGGLRPQTMPRSVDNNNQSVDKSRGQNIIGDVLTSGVQVQWH